MSGPGLREAAKTNKYYPAVLLLGEHKAPRKYPEHGSRHDSQNGFHHESTDFTTSPGGVPDWEEKDLANANF